MIWDSPVGRILLYSEENNTIKRFDFSVYMSNEKNGMTKGMIRLGSWGEDNDTSTIYAFMEMSQ